MALLHRSRERTGKSLSLSASPGLVWSRRAPTKVWRPPSSSNRAGHSAAVHPASGQEASLTHTHPELMDSPEGRAPSIPRYHPTQARLSAPVQQPRRLWPRAIWNFQYLSSFDSPTWRFHMIQPNTSEFLFQTSEYHRPHKRPHSFIRTTFFLTFWKSLRIYIFNKRVLSHVSFSWKWSTGSEFRAHVQGWSFLLHPISGYHLPSPTLLATLLWLLRLCHKCHFSGMPPLTAWFCVYMHHRCPCRSHTSLS